jgi:hypothetical protein
MRWMKKVDRDGPEREFDYYYITSKDKELLEKYNLRIIGRYDLSDTYLAVRNESIVK